MNNTVTKTSSPKKKQNKKALFTSSISEEKQSLKIFLKSGHVRLYFKTLISLIKAKEIKNNKTEKEQKHSLMNSFLDYFNNDYKQQATTIKDNNQQVKFNEQKFNNWISNHRNKIQTEKAKYKKTLIENHEKVSLLSSSLPLGLPKVSHLNHEKNKELSKKIHSTFAKKHALELKKLSKGITADKPKKRKLEFKKLKQEQKSEINKFTSDFYIKCNVLKPVYLKFAKTRELLKTKISKINFQIIRWENLETIKSERKSYLVKSKKLFKTVKEDNHKIENKINSKLKEVKSQQVKFKGSLSKVAKLEIKKFKYLSSSLVRQTSKSNFQQKSDPFIKFITKATGVFERNRYLDTLKNAFGSLIPIIIIGALGVLFSAAIFGASGNAQASLMGVILPNQVDFSGLNPGSTYIVGSTAATIAAYAQIILVPLNFVTLGSLSLYTAFLFGFFLAKKSNYRTPFFAGLFSMMAFLISTISFAPFTTLIFNGVSTSGTSIDFQVVYFGAQGLLSAIIVALVTTELFLIFDKSKTLKIKMPKSVPQGISDSFNSLIPGVLSIVCLSALNSGFVLWATFGNVNTLRFETGDPNPIVTIDRFSQGFATMVATFVNDPLIAFASSEAGNIPIAYFYIFTLSLIWFLGLHGAAITQGAFLPILLQIQQNNLTIFNERGAVGLAADGAIFSLPTFDAYLFFGGWGTGLAFGVITLLFGKNKIHRKITSIAAPGLIFNINEPILYGIPFVLNFPIFISILILHATQMGMVILFTEGLGLVLPSFNFIPWTSPIIFGSLLSVAFQPATVAAGLGPLFVVILPLINLALAVVVYIPITVVYNKRYIKQEKLKISAGTRLQESTA